MAILLNSNGPVDATNPDNLSQKVAPEYESRKRFLSFARANGVEREMLLLFAKYDKLIRNCTNEKEQEDIRKLGAIQVYKLLGGGGELYINGELVCQDTQKDYGGELYINNQLVCKDR